MNAKTLLLAGVALAAGLLVGFVVPSGWLFVDGDAHARHRRGDDGTQYACPMFCVLMEELPDDKKCPVCGMQMTPVRGESTLNEQERHMVGLEVSTVARMRLARTVRVVAEVDYDETRVSKITARAAGWLERVWVDTTWMRVTKGQKLAAIYSPELYAAQKEFLIAARTGAEDDAMLAAATRRLRLFGVGDEEIEQLRESGEVQEALVLRAPRDGVVVARHVLEGGMVKVGEPLYTIADLSQVWVQAEVFESDLPWVREGQTARLRTESGVDELTGRVSFIDPVLHRATRTARLRIVVDNPVVRDGVRRLRVGARADVWIESALGADGRPRPPDAADEDPPLAVPRSAVLSTGERSVMYLLFEDVGGQRNYAVDPDRLPAVVFYELVPVRVGPPGRRLGDPTGPEFYPLLGIAKSAGEAPEGLGALRAGLAVVTEGNLLLDSQAQLSGKPSLLFPEGNRGGGGGDPHAGH